MIGLARRTLWSLVIVLVPYGGIGGEIPLRGQVPDSTSTSTVRGRVLEHETGVPLPGAVVSLTSLVGGVEVFETRMTGGEGGFLFEDFLPGLYHLRVTLFSYHELRDTLGVDPESELYLTLPLSVSPVRLEPIVVVSKRQPLGPMRGFEMRRQRSTGIFLTREEIEASSSYEFTDLFRRFPGIRVVPTAAFGHRVLFRGGCVPDLWVDGTLAGTTPDLDSFLRPEELEAVEVYQGADLPIEFGSNLCGAIVVWTRRGRATTGEGKSLRGQLIFAGSFIILSIFSILLSR